MIVPFQREKTRGIGSSRKVGEAPGCPGLRLSSGTGWAGTVGKEC
jgi:hypothetical protein